MLRRLLLAVFLSLALGAGAAHAGGPGVTVFSKASPQPLTLSGDQIAVAADVPPTRYTLRASPGSAGTTVTLRGTSIRALLVRAGVDPETITFVSVVRANGSLLALTRADIADPPPFPEGPALIADLNGTTRFLRPVRDLKGTNAADYIETTSAGPLLVSVDGYASLAVKASASRTKVKTGDNVTFSARVRFKPPGAQLTYHWEFSDGFSADGPQVTHAFATPGDQQAQVTVSGTGGADANCASVCGGVTAVDVRVGEPAKQPTAPDTTAGTGTGNPQAPGSAGDEGAAGRGGSGGGPGAGSIGVLAVGAKDRLEAKSAPLPARRPDSAARPAAGGLQVTGVLLSGEDALTGELPQPKAVSAQEGGNPKGVQATRGGSDDPAELGGGLALVFAVMGLGALRERRRVKLRVA